MRIGSVAAVIAAAVLIGVAIWFASGRADAPSSGRLQLCATISPLADWVREVAGPDADVHCLVDGSKDPHHFEPTAQDALRISASRAVFAVGLGMDEWAETFVKNAERGDKLVLFETGEWIEPRKLEVHEIEIGGALRAHEPRANEPRPQGSGHHHHGSEDPHYWQDPRRAMTVVARIADELIKIDPAHKSGYESRRDACLQKLKALDTLVESAAALIPKNQQLVTFHDAYGYLFERLHIHIAAVVQVTPGVEPSLKDCAEAIHAMREIGQKVVFKEPAGSDRAIEVIAKDLGITQVEILDPLDNEISPVGKNYFERMKHNVLTVAKTLSDRPAEAAKLE
ncbi:MAG TPA: metal ABC transporter substrate-binding protein [Planctomycetota bacterium]|nr:metal ABC transporter substrate-binding protein [Planctomycetota bacterium]